MNTLVLYIKVVTNCFNKTGQGNQEYSVKTSKKATNLDGNF